MDPKYPPPDWEEHKFRVTHERGHSTQYAYYNKGKGIIVFKVFHWRKRYTPTEYWEYVEFLNMGWREWMKVLPNRDPDDLLRWFLRTYKPTKPRPKKKRITKPGFLHDYQEHDFGLGQAVSRVDRIYYKESLRFLVVRTHYKQSPIEYWGHEDIEPEEFAAFAAATNPEVFYIGFYHKHPEQKTLNEPGTPPKPEPEPKPKTRTTEPAAFPYRGYEFHTFRGRSSSIKAIYYDPEYKMLRVRFHKSATNYLFTGVPLAVYEKFKEAPSPGSFYWGEISRHYADSTRGASITD